MFEQDDDIVERMIRQLRRPVSIDPGLDARVMGEIAAAAQPGKRRTWPWLAAAAAAWPSSSSPVPGRWTPARAERTLSSSCWWLPRPHRCLSSATSTIGIPPVPPCTRPTASGRPSSRSPPGAIATRFLVNGVEWRADPAAPNAIDDEFGTPSSV